MAFEENTLLFGSDPTERIVAIELGETGTVKVYRREKDGSTSLDIEELRRLQLEVLSFVGGETEIPDASQPADHVMSIALSDNSGWEELIVVDPAKVEESERAALKRLTAIIKERDPDVIEGHNLFRFDLPYLVARARKAKVKLDWGRSGGFLRSRPSRL